MFALLGGLSNPAVSRLKESWEKIRGKTLRRYQSLEKLMDPTRNMSAYRSLLDAQLRRVGSSQPLIPLLPLIKKDLTFIHEANPSFDSPDSSTPAQGGSTGSKGKSVPTHSLQQQQQLVNFDKMRLVSREIRKLTSMSSTNYVSISIIGSMYLMHSCMYNVHTLVIVQAFLIFDSTVISHRDCICQIFVYTI